MTDNSHSVISTESVRLISALELRRMIECSVAYKNGNLDPCQPSWTIFYNLSVAETEFSLFLSQ